MLIVVQLLQLQLKQPITKIYSHNWTEFLQSINYTCLTYRSFNNFVALHADVFETPVSCASPLRDPLGEVQV